MKGTATNGIAAAFPLLAASVLGRLGDHAGSGVGLGLHGQQVRPEAQQEIGVLPLPDTFHRQARQLTQEIGKAFQDVVLGDHHH